MTFSKYLGLSFAIYRHLKLSTYLGFFDLIMSVFFIVIKIA